MELVSGPDLGAGFLFQLTVDSGDGPSHWTVHAQEGGLDASGPPKGPPVPLGFRRYRGLCPIGGRSCYHRDLEADPRDAPRVRMAYNRTRFVMAALLDQEFAGVSVPLEQTLIETVGRIAPALRDAGTPWFIGGATAAWLHGMGAAPRVIEIGTDPAGVVEIADALPEYLIDPPATTGADGDRRTFAARAFVGTLKAGARVEWSSADRARPPFPPTSEWGRLAGGVPVLEVRRGDRDVPACRPEFLLYGAPRAALAARAQRVVALGVNEELLAELQLAASPSEGAAVAAAVAAASAGSAGS